MTNILDHAILDELRQLDPDGSSGFLASIVEVFDSQCDVLLPELLSAAEAADVDAIGKKAHKLKGSARTIGAAYVGDLCETLELGARAGSVPDPVAQVQAIIAATNEARAALAQL